MKYIALSLSNDMIVSSGNEARDHLANERTILAYIRTSLSLILLAIVIVQININYSNNLSYKPLIIIIFTLSIITLIIGTIRYIRIQYLLNSITNDVFESGTYLIILILILLIIIIIMYIIHVNT